MAKVVMVVLAALTLGGCAQWVTYHGDAGRSGADPDRGAPVAPTVAWHSPTLDGQVYGEPLIVGPLVFAATGNDTVYALNASTGAILWQRHLATAVPASAVPCGDIVPTVGIVSTPVVDLHAGSSGTVFVVADVWDGSHAHHVLFGLGLSNGVPTMFRGVDVPGPGGGANPEFIPLNQLQRAALAIAGGRVVASFGGNDGDCGHYHGWVVSSTENGSGSLASYQVGHGVAGDVGGAVWAGGGGPPVDGSGDLYVTTGNGSSTTTYDHGSSVIKLDPSMHELDHYAPSTWPILNAGDLDLGSASAILLPNNLVFTAGKDGIGRILLDATNYMGGTGVPGKPDPSRFHAPVCGSDNNGSYGGPAYAGGKLFVPCGSGVQALSVNPSAMTFSKLWTGPGIANGPPIVADGIVWVVAWGGAGTLYGLDESTGAIRFQASAPGLQHFATPAAGDGHLVLATGNRLVAYRISATAG